MKKDQRLAHPKILLVEDDETVALYLTDLIEEAGMSVIGPVGRVAEALALIEEHGTSINAAILDINLHGVFSYPIADALIQRGIRFVFTTGYGTGSLSAAYAAYPRCEKPFREDVLLEALARAICPSAA